MALDWGSSPLGARVAVKVICGAAGSSMVSGSLAGASSILPQEARVQAAMAHRADMDTSICLFMVLSSSKVPHQNPNGFSSVGSKPERSPRPPQMALPNEKSTTVVSGASYALLADSIIHYFFGSTNLAILSGKIHCHLHSLQIL
jgi:hypothetical protein